jgi:hypothetical protein
MVFCEKKEVMKSPHLTSTGLTLNLKTTSSMLFRDVLSILAGGMLTLAGCHYSQAAQEPPQTADQSEAAGESAPLPDQKLESAEGVSVEVSDSMLVFKSNSVLATFSLRAGIALESLREINAEVECLKAGDILPLFMVNGPGLSVSSAQFQATGVTLRKEDKTVSAEVTLSSKDSSLISILQIKMTHEGKMTWQLKVDSKIESVTRLQLVFPIIGKIQIGADLAENRFFFPQRTGIEGAANLDITHEYGTLAWMQVIGVHSPATETRLSVYPMDSTGTFKGLRFKKVGPGGGEVRKWAELLYDPEIPKRDPLNFKGEGMGLAYYSLREPLSNGSMTSPEYVVSIGPGGWKETLREYSNWVRTWYQAPNPPKWFHQVFNFWNVHPSRFWLDAENRYNGTEVIEATKGDGEVDIVQWAYWEDYDESLVEDPGFKRYQPGDFNYHKARGGLAPFKEEVKRHQDKGIRVTLYTDCRFVYRNSEFGKQMGEGRSAMHTPKAKTAMANGEIYCFCIYDTEGWWEQYTQSLARIVRETGIDGVYLDELGINFPNYNPTALHWKEKPVPQSPSRLSKNLIYMRDEIRKANPEAVVWLEHAGNDWLTQFADGSWVQTFYSEQYEWVVEEFDDQSLYFFRFYFPEYVLAEWGPSTDGRRRCFFNGIGRDTGCGPRLDAILREHADTFATKEPEPAMPTLVEGVLANKFPGNMETIVTIYNKSGADHEGDLIALPMSGKKNWKIKELVTGKECTFRYDLANNNLVVAADIAKDGVGALLIKEVE